VLRVPFDHRCDGGERAVTDRILNRIRSGNNAGRGFSLRCANLEKCGLSLPPGKYADIIRRSPKSAINSAAPRPSLRENRRPTRASCGVQQRDLNGSFAANSTPLSPLVVAAACGKIADFMQVITLQHSKQFQRADPVWLFA
jgi:hypothetical protein